MSDLFSRMAAERARVLVERKKPIGWKLNEAALNALRLEGVIDDADLRHPIEKSLFGLPVLRDDDDQSEEARFSILVVNTEV